MRVGDRVHYVNQPDWIGTVVKKKSSFCYTWFFVEFDDYLPKEFAADCKLMFFGEHQLTKIND